MTRTGVESGRGRDVLPPGDEHDLARALAELALEQAAPEELALFPETVDEYFRDPEAALHPRQREEAVGFGLELALVTPYLLAIATYVVKMLASIVEQSVQEELKPSVAQLVHRLFRKGQETATGQNGPAPLTATQLRDVRDSAYHRGIDLGLDEARATLLADSVVGHLVTA